MSHARLYWYHIQSAQLHIEGGVAPEERGVGVRWRREEKTWGRLSADGGDLPWFRGCFPLTAVLSPSVLSEVRSSLNVAARFHSASLKKPTSLHAQVWVSTWHGVCAWRQTRGRHSSGVPRSSRAPRGELLWARDRSITSDGSMGPDVAAGAALCGDSRRGR